MGNRRYDPPSAKMLKRVQVLSLFSTLHIEAKALKEDKKNFGHHLNRLLGDEQKIGLVEEIERHKGREVLGEMLQELE